MRKALEQRRTTSREIVQQYLTRIALYEHRLNTAITINPNALADVWADVRAVARLCLLHVARTARPA